MHPSDVSNPGSQSTIPETTGRNPRSDEEYNEEISLADFMHVLVKWWKFLVIIFLLSISTAYIFTLRKPKVYKANASILVMPSQVLSGISPKRSFLDPGFPEKGGILEQKPAISVLTHRSLLLSNTMLDIVLDKVQEGGYSNTNMTVETLAQNIEVKTSGQTNILELSAKNPDPKFAQTLVNIWAQEYARYSQDLITGEIRGSVNFVVEQFEKAQENLTKAEQALDAFNVDEELSLWEIEIAEKQKQLESHYTRMQSLNFELQEAKSKLKKIDRDIVAMTCGNNWIGTYKTGGQAESSSENKALDEEQKKLCAKVLRTKTELQQNRKLLDDFTNESKITLLIAELENRQKTQVEDIIRLNSIRQACESTTADLNSDVSLDMFKNEQGLVVEGLPELTVWELLSLMKGYNFLATRERSLQIKIEKQEKELLNLEKQVFSCTEKQAMLTDNYNRAKANYDFYHEQFKSLQQDKNSTEKRISDLEFQLTYSTDFVTQLKSKVSELKTIINKKKARLTDLTRQLEIANKIYSALTSKVEEARIARAIELGDVKVVSMAFKPLNPITPKKGPKVALSGIIGLGMGVFAAFVLEFRRHIQAVTHPTSRA